MKEKHEEKEQCRNSKESNVKLGSKKTGILFLSFVLFQIISLGKFSLFLTFQYNFFNLYLNIIF